MAFNLDELNDIEISDIGTWPEWLRIAMAFVVFLGLLGGGYYFLVGKQLQDLAQLERQESELKRTYTRNKEKVINLPLYREQIEQIQGNFSVIAGQLPNRAEVPQLLIDITQAGLARGLEFRKFEPKEEQRADFYATLPIDISVVGTYHQFGQFASDLASLPRIVTLGDLNISGADNGRLTVNTVVNTYRYLDEDESSSGS